MIQDDGARPEPSLRPAGGSTSSPGGWVLSPRRLRALLWSLLGVATIAALFAALSWHSEPRASRRELAQLAALLETERIRGDALERQVTDTAQRLTAYRQEVQTLREVRRDQADRLERSVRALEAERDASERIIGAYGAGVPLIQGVVTYEDATGRPLRYVRVDAHGRPALGPLGAPRMTVDGEGPPVRTTFLGTGFLVSRDGAILTSRHVARPWVADAALAAFLEEERVRPRVSQLRAFFPGSPAPVSVRAVRASATADLVVLRGAPPRSAPVLPLDLEGTDAVPGRPVVVLGYPAGLELLLARVPPAVLETLIDGSVTEITDTAMDVPALIERLSRLGLIRPYPTWGRLADRRPHQLAHDADTSIGGSGGPIFATSGRVIGLTSAVARDFDSAALGVPIREAIGPLGRARRSAAADRETEKP